MITTTIVYDHRGRTQKDKEGPVEVRVTIDRKPYYINTGIKVTRRRLRAGVIVDADGSTDADELNNRLSVVYKRISQELNSCIEDGRGFDVACIRRRVWCMDVTDEKKKNATIVEWIKEQEPLMGVSDGRAKHYGTLRARLGEFGLMNDWKDVTVEMLYRWDAFLHGLRLPVTENQRRAGVKGELISQSTIHNYHKNLKAMLNRAVRLGVIQANPYERLRGQFKKGERETVDYLTQEQMQAMESLVCRDGSQEAMARDVFLFQMYTGLAYADAQSFDVKQYKKVVSKDGCEQWVNVGQRMKTGVPYVSVLLPQAVEVLERNGWHVPRINNQRYNQKLKEIGKRIGIEGLHSHMARHTFATWAIHKGVPIQVVSKMIGHTNIKQTQRYAKVLAEDVMAEFEKLK